MAGKIPVISIVCPAFQEEDVLPLFHRELSTVLGRLDGSCNMEIIYVDDGSTDGTLQVLRELAAADKRIRYLSLSRNFGHQAALTAGLEHSRGDVIITMDSDLQHPPALLPTLLNKWREGFDIVLTIREDDPRLSSFKRNSSRWFYRIMSFLSDTDIRLAAADYRLMSRKAVDALLQLRETHRFLRGMVGWLGFPVAEIPFQPAVRKAGVSKYTFRKMFNFALDGMLSFSKLPLRLALVLGVVTIVVSLVLSGWAVVRLLLPHGGTDLGSALLIISTQFIGGCILLCLGIVGEYVGRIYQQVQGRPIYLLKEYWPQTPADLTGFSADRVMPKPVGWSPKHDQTAA